MKRGALIKTDKAIDPVGAKMSVAEMLRAFDDLWRVEHQQDIEKLKAKEVKARRLRAAIAALVDN